MLPPTGKTNMLAPTGKTTSPPRHANPQSDTNAPLSPQKRLEAITEGPNPKINRKGELPSQIPKNSKGKLSENSGKSKPNTRGPTEKQAGRGETTQASTRAASGRGNTPSKQLPNKHSTHRGNTKAPRSSQPQRSKGRRS